MAGKNGWTRKQEHYFRPQTEFAATFGTLKSPGIFPITFRCFEVQPMTLFYIALAASFAAEVMRFVEWIERK